MPPRRETRLPTTSDELAQLIAQHVTTALEQHEANQAAGRGWSDTRGPGGAPIGAPQGKCIIGKFCNLIRYDII